MARAHNKYIIGLTGNIAVGKSVVRRMLQHLGAYTIDADSLSHQAMMPGAPAYKPVIEMFGRYIVDPNGQINRARLGGIVFALPDALATLESIVHPIVGGAVQALISRATQRVVVIEAIKLFEGSLASMCDSVWVVDAPVSTQIERLMSKRGMSESEARSRILVQNAQEDKVKRAHVVIDNSGDVDQTWKQVQAHWNRIVSAPPAPPAGAQTATAPAAPPVKPIPSTETQESALIDGVRVRRGTPNHAAEIAEFIHKLTGRAVSRMDIMLNFGQKSYHIALDAGGHLLGVIGWQVENLITTIDELYIPASEHAGALTRRLIEAIENAAGELQSEVSFIFLPTETDSPLHATFSALGYAPLKIETLNSPAWREAAREQTRSGRSGLIKPLRADRITKPI